MLFYMPVKIYTGEGCLAEHGEEIAKYGKRFLIQTGRSSASRSGALQCHILPDHGDNVISASHFVDD